MSLIYSNLGGLLSMVGNKQVGREKEDPFQFSKLPCKHRPTFPVELGYIQEKGRFLYVRLHNGCISVIYTIKQIRHILHTIHNMFLFKCCEILARIKVYTQKRRV